MHLDKTAFQTCHMLPEEAKGSYGAMVNALKEAVSASGHRRTEGHGIPSNNPRDRISQEDWN